LRARRCRSGHFRRDPSSHSNTRRLAFEPLETRELLSLTPPFVPLNTSDSSLSREAGTFSAGIGSSVGEEMTSARNTWELIVPEWFGEYYPGLAASSNNSAITGEKIFSELMQNTHGPFPSGSNSIPVYHNSGFYGTLRTSGGLLQAEGNSPGESSEPTFPGEFSSREWIVRLEEAILPHVSTVGQAFALLEIPSETVRAVQGLGQVGLLKIEWTSEHYAQIYLNMLANKGLIAEYEPNGVLSAAVIPNDPLFAEQWGLHNIGGSAGLADADVDAPEAWDQTVGHSSVVVAVVDSGIDYRHRDLASNIWVNPREIPGNGVDDDGNGFVDDIYGYDFANGDGDPWDDHGHGSHVAGIIGAVGNNGEGIAGVAWQVQLMPLKFLGAGGVGSVADAVRAINYATMMRSRYGVNICAINASWGGSSYSGALEGAIRAAGEAGILFVTAAGNDSRNNDLHSQYPANYDLPNVITVAASDRYDRLASFSNFGQQKVHLVAPGVQILSTVPGGGYQQLSGTSMAAPFVSGAVALAAAAAPGASASELRQAVFQGVDRLVGFGSLVATGGRLNARGTLNALIFRVLSSTPDAGAVLSEPPKIFRLQLSGVVDPSSLRPESFWVNGLPADSVRVVGAREVEFTFRESPVHTEGPQHMVLKEGTIRQAGSGQLVRGWSAIFYYDVIRGTVVATDPPSDAVLPSPPCALLLTWNEPLDPDAVSPENLLLSEGRVAGVELRSPEVLAYLLADLPRDGQVTYHLPAGVLRDIHGNPVGGYSGQFFIRDPNLLRVSSLEVPKPIYDMQWTRSSLIVSESVTISDLDVMFTLEHTYTADLDIYLVGPGGTRILLLADVGGSGRDFFQTILDDQAAVPITGGMAPFRGRFRPLEPLASFVGQNAQGVWTLEIYDDSLMDQGRLVQWELWITRGGEIPMQVTSINPTAEITGEILEPVRQFEISFSRPVYLRSRAAGSEGVTLVACGPDGLWETTDDLRFGLEAVPSSEPAGTLRLVPDAGRLPPGNYRLRLAADTFRDERGIPLDGDGDGLPGGDYVFTFRVLPALFYDSGPVNLPIRDLQTIWSQIEVPEDFIIRNLDVFVDIEHTFVADLDVFLIAPDGTRVELFTDVGRNGRNFSRTILDDEAPVAIGEGSAPFEGRFRPEGALRSLYGRSAYGIWTLEVSDDSRRDEGTLLRWGLVVEGRPLLPPRLAGIKADLNPTSGPGSILVHFTEPMDPASFRPEDDILGFRGPAGPIPILGYQWLEADRLVLTFPGQQIQGEYRLELGPQIASRLGFHLDSDGDGQPGEIPEDILRLRIPVPVELGAAGWISREVFLSSAAPVAWFAFENLFGGSINCRISREEEVPLRAELYRDPFSAPLSTAEGLGAIRLDVVARAAGSRWYLRVEGPPGPIRLEAANVVEFVEGPVGIVHGTAQDDRLAVEVGSSVWSLVFNGLPIELPRGTIWRLNLLGGGGQDHLTIRWAEEVLAQIDPSGGFLEARRDLSQVTRPLAAISSSFSPVGVVSWEGFQGLVVEVAGGAVECVDLLGQAVSFSVGQMEVEWGSDTRAAKLKGFQRIRAEVAAPESRAVIRGNSHSERLTAVAGQVKWQSGEIQVELKGFGSVDAFAGRGGEDVAVLKGSIGDDTAVLSPAGAVLTSPNHVVRALGFGSVSVYSAPGGRDLARFFDSPLDDLFTVTPQYVNFSTPDVLLRAIGFPLVTLQASGGTDTVRLYDSVGDDVLSASSDYFRWQGPGFEIRGSAFERVLAYSSAGGKDRASLVGSEGRDSLRALSGSVILRNDTYYLQTSGFAYVAAYGVGGQDRADLYDTPSDDSLVATPAYTMLRGSGYEIRVFGFSEVNAYSTGEGSDSARLYPLEARTSVVLTATYGTLQGAGFYARAWNFGSVVAYAPGQAASQAKLYGTAGNERLTEEGRTVGLVGASWRRYAVGYTQVYVYGNGGMDVAELTLNPGPAWVQVRFRDLAVESAEFRLWAYGISRFSIRAQPGSDHRATIFDTPARDLLEAFPNHVRLSAQEISYLAELFYFSRVEAHTTGTGDRRLMADGVDYLLTFGDWE
jgi:subtilisin family serine protease/subtilisin-like proprotein convertase family protein